MRTPSEMHSGRCSIYLAGKNRLPSVNFVDFRNTVPRVDRPNDRGNTCGMVRDFRMCTLILPIETNVTLSVFHSTSIGSNDIGP